MVEEVGREAGGGGGTGNHFVVTPSSNNLEHGLIRFTGSIVALAVEHDLFVQLFT